MNKKRKKIELLIPIVALLLCAVVVMLERFGITKEFLQQDVVLEEGDYSKPLELPHNCLVITDSTQEVSETYMNMLTVVLEDMSVGYDVMDLKRENIAIRFNLYDRVILVIEDWSKLVNQIQEFNGWVKNGGSVMVALTPQPGNVFQVVSNKMGISSGIEQYVSINGFHVLNNSMIGAQEEDVFYFDDEKKESVMTSLDVQLSDTAKICVESAENEVPILWSQDYGAGRYVVLNDILAEKYQRGFLATAYSLMEDVTIYPVINASAYYLDDFPSPVPGGNGTYIERDYGVDTATFYSTIWWPEVLKWEEDYGIKHTGLIIENYSDQVEAPFPANDDLMQFTRYGNMLLNKGGELGYHGYNHMSLCQEGIDDERKLGDYKLWPTFEDMKAGLGELQRFANHTFPDEKFQVYVPPSNIISDTGLQAIREQCPEIKVIASSYMHDSSGRELEQEFGVADNGFIYTPRVTSGCSIDGYQKLTAMSELNMHYVQSHFLHPDDMLDEDRGAALGWGKVSKDFRTVYLDWLKRTVPNIRQVTGSVMGQAVQDFSNINVIYEQTDEQVQGSVGGFEKEAYLMMRLQGRTPGESSGCEVESVTGDLYLIHVTETQFSVKLGM